MQKRKYSRCKFITAFYTRIRFRVELSGISKFGLLVEMLRISSHIRSTNCALGLMSTCKKQIYIGAYVQELSKEQSTVAPKPQQTSNWYIASDLKRK